MTTLTYSGRLTVLACWCGIHHAVPEEMRKDQLRCWNDGRKIPDIYCPLGHTHVPAGEGEAARLERQLAASRDRSARLAAERDQIKASLTAQKGATTRAKKRAAAAVCPCCKRSFVQLRRHMASKHPGYDPTS